MWIRDMRCVHTYIIYESKRNKENAELANKEENDERPCSDVLRSCSFTTHVVYCNFRQCIRGNSFFCFYFVLSFYFSLCRVVFCALIFFSNLWLFVCWRERLAGYFHLIALIVFHLTDFHHSIAVKYSLDFIEHTMHTHTHTYFDRQASQYFFRTLHQLRQISFSMVATFQ